MVLNRNDFYIWQISSEPFVSFSKLDDLGRTGTAMACLGKETLPTETRSQINMIQPSGWQNTQYENLIEEKYLYNRSHLIGYQFCSEDAIPENIFTGTRYLNADSMLFLENKISAYIEENAGDTSTAAEESKGHHVIYRVTPVYEDNNLVASGVQMEAFSVEDYGKSICFNAFVYNVHPGIKIDYKSGESEVDRSYKKGKEISAAEAFSKLSEPVLMSLDEAESTDSQAAGDRGQSTVESTEPASPAVQVTPEPQITESAEEEQTVTYILNKNSKKFHRPNCSSVDDMKEKNKQEFYGTREEAIAQGYEPCKRCHP